MSDGRFPDGNVSGGRNLAILPLHGRVFLGKAKIPLGFAIHLASREVSGKSRPGRLDHRHRRHGQLIQNQPDHAPAPLVMPAPQGQAVYDTVVLTGSCKTGC